MRVLTGLLAAMFLAGCAASGSIQQISESAVAIDSSRSGSLVVTSRMPNRDSVVEDLRLAISLQLQAKRVFRDLSELPEGADVVLNVTISEVTEIGFGLRILLGVFAGKARLVADVDVVDRASGQSLGKMKAEGLSSNGSGFSGTTSEALDQVAMQIADYLLSNRRLQAPSAGSR